MRLVLILYGYYFNKCSPFPCCLVMQRTYKKFLKQFMSQTPLEYQKDAYTSSFISHIVRLWNSFLADCNPFWFVIKTRYLKSPFIAWNTVLKSNSILQRNCLPLSQKPIFRNLNSFHHPIQDWKATTGQGVTGRREALRKAD